MDKSRVAVGGKETDMQVAKKQSTEKNLHDVRLTFIYWQVWDLGRPEHALFRAKNVRPDMLELRQEVS